jgi:hypothetical protein
MENSSQSPLRGVVGCLINLTGFDSEGESTLAWRRLRGWGRRTGRIIGWWKSPLSRHDVRKKRCIT